MIFPATVALTAERFAPLYYEFAVTGLDLTGATLAAQVRLYAGAPGSPLINLGQVFTAGVDGVRLLSAAGWPDPTATISITIGQSVIQALPATGGGRTDSLAWDLVVTPPGMIKSVLLGGPFIIQPGVTQL